MSDATPDLLLKLDDESDADPVLDLTGIFGNDRPVELELGLGKGRFILDAASRRPEHNFLGVELAGKYLRLARDRALKRGLTNLRFVHGDAREFIEFFLPAGAVHALHVYFPDPWPKARHHKRRLLTAPGFLDEALRILEPQGRLWLATDHDDYWEAITEAIEPYEDRFETVAAEWVGPTTNYEDKFLSRGSSIHRRVLRRR